MSAHRPAALALVLALGFAAGPAHAQRDGGNDAGTPAQLPPPGPPPATGAEALEKKAEFWEAQGRVDRAISTWEQLLKLEPTNTKARANLDRLRGPKPSADPASRANEARLAEARRLAQGGRYKEAVQRYREYFAPNPTPPDSLALEYYQTQGGIQTEKDKAEALAGLKGLVDKDPNCTRCWLAWAQQLTYEERTRREGIARLEAITLGPGGAGLPRFTPKEQDEARRAWKNALLWLGAKWADRSLYLRYLEKYPDPLVAAKLASITQDGVGVVKKGPPSVWDARLRAAYQKLNDGLFDEAAERFNAILADHPKLPEAIVGLAWVRIRQERFIDGRELARRARDIAPNRKALWEAPLRIAEFWALVHEAGEARQKGDYAQAEALLKSAMAMPMGDETLRAKLLLADVWLDADRLADAERAYRELLGHASTRADAARGLYIVLLRLSRTEEADRLEREVQGTLTEKDRAGARVQGLVARSRLEADKGNWAKSIEILKQALALDPTNKALRIELIYRHLSNLDIGAARRVADDLLRDFPGDADVAAAAGLVEYEDEDFGAALRILDSVDLKKLSANAKSLRLESLYEVRVREALALRNKECGAMQRRMQQIEQEAGKNPEALSIVALAWSKAGHHDHALDLVRRVLASDPARGSRFRSAAVLLAAGERSESRLKQLLAELEAAPKLSPRERMRLDDLQRALALRLADRARERGDYRRAFLTLEPHLKKTPDDLTFLSALARLYMSAGEPRKARAIYDPLLRKYPNDLGVLEGAAYAAWADGDGREARLLGERALARFHDEPRAYLFTARISIFAGDDARGEELLRQGIEIAKQKPDDNGGEIDCEVGGEGEAFLSDARERFAGIPGIGRAELVPSVRRELQEELDRLLKRYAPSIEARFAFRYRSGEPGLGRVYEIAAPVVAHLSPRMYGHFYLRVTPLWLTARSTDLSSQSTAEQFASFGTVFPSTLSQTLPNENVGVAGALRYEYRGFFAEIGFTPFGFPVVDVAGEIGWTGSIGQLSLGARGFRSAVTDSVLSYGGLSDTNRGGIVWGGVRRTGGEIGVSYQWQQGFGLSAFGAYSIYTGENVAFNHGGQYGAAASWRFVRAARQDVSTGLGLFFMHYDKDLRYFSFGHGGYFSPQMFVSGGIPITWRRDGDRLRHKLTGELGVNFYHEDAIDVYPTDAILQQMRAQLPIESRQSLGTQHPEFDRLGPYARILFNVEYDVVRQWTVLGHFSAQFATQFNEVMFNVGVRGHIL